ncbi:MAG: hypothetical protein ACKOZW_05585 [Cyanobium sp.]
MPKRQFRIRHQLPHRLRVAFGEQLNPGDLRSLIWHLERQHPEAIVRPTSLRQGLVIASRHSLHPLDDPVGSLEALLAKPLTIIPEPEPRGWKRGLAGSLQRSRELLIALAIAGWVLPILPGTPFFLLAWWMGWRPEAKNDPNSSLDGEPGGDDQAKSITSQGDSTRADRHTR